MYEPKRSIQPVIFPASLHTIGVKQDYCFIQMLSLLELIESFMYCDFKRYNFLVTASLEAPQ